MSVTRWIVAAVLCPSLAAQQGDRTNEVQTPVPDSLVVPEATPRDAKAQLATFKVAPGYRIEAFAHEPMVRDPVAAAFDSSFRLWVVEMRGYMNDIVATDERVPNGRIVVLTDKDHDGVADDAVTFLDGLVLPRAVLPLRGGALVITPPELWWCPDADGDLRADGKVVVTGGFEAGLENPEHSGNGLLWGFDHRIHLANDQRLLRGHGGAFTVEMGAGGGQWGITHDDRGRLWFNYNEDWLRCDLVPGRHGPQASAAGGLALLNHRAVPERSVWPIRITPGVNRGYQPGRLVDWVLAIHTAVCAPLVYRGGLLPECDGDVFVCEPAGNLVRRFVPSNHDGLLRARNPYEDQRGEFLASTDERFRPVHLLTGPEGALYVVDMYRGVIQHRNFVTTFLRRQIEKRGLERPIGLGRIWRIVPDAKPTLPVPAVPASLAVAPLPEVVLALAHQNGAVRDLALRELVQRGDRSAVPAVRALSVHERAAVRIASLSVLAGLHALTATDVRAGLRDRDPGVVAFVLQHAGPFLVQGDRLVRLAVAAALASDVPTVRWHAVLACGPVFEAGTPIVARCAAVPMLAAALQAHEDPNLRAVVATVAGARLADVVAAVGDDWPGGESARNKAVRDLAMRGTKSRDPQTQQAFFELAATSTATAWRTRAVLEGMVEALPKAAQRSGWLSFPAVPAALVALASHAEPAIAANAATLLGAIAITGAAAPLAAAAELTADERARVVAGEVVFRRTCAACHQLDGNGMQGLAPPLRDSEWVLGSPDRLVRILLHGVKGPIEVAGVTWTMEMPGQSHLSNADLAAVASYVRRAFGHRDTAVLPAAFESARTAHRGRSEPWTAAELVR